MEGREKKGKRRKGACQELGFNNIPSEKYHSVQSRPRKGAMRWGLGEMREKQGGGEGG